MSADITGLEKPRAKSLIVTVYGDAILPHGGECWLGALIELVAPLGLNERVTRTAVFRLVQDGVLEAERVGRQSRYRLTAEGRRQFDNAQARIYAADAPTGDGRWTLIALPDGLSAPVRDALSRDLGWQGFARLTSGLLGAARGSAAAEAATVIAAHGLVRDCPVFTATPQDAADLARLAAEAWSLDGLANDYSRFVTAFQALNSPDGDAGAFARRTLLIHHYRRALLRDPALPEALLPADWPGRAARMFTTAQYRALAAPSERHLEAVLKAPPANAALARRFT